jgi:hypothetical protein
VNGREDILNPLDPYNINPRLQAWVSELIERREEMDMNQQVRAISAIGRIQIMYIKLREEGGGGYATGTEVKRFAEAFAANATDKRKINRRSTAAIAELEYDDGPDD